MTGTHANTRAFFIGHLVEMAKTTHNNVIGVGGTITAIAKLWAMGGNLALLSLSSLEGNLILPPYPI